MLFRVGKATVTHPDTQPARFCSPGCWFRYPGVASRVAQVESIIREIENMHFIRTSEGMKAVMKAELPVVEAILQVRFARARRRQ